MGVLYVSFGSKLRPRTFGCIAMGSAVLFILTSRLLLYSAGSGVNRMQAVLAGISVRLFCPGKNGMYIWLYVFPGGARARVFRFDSDVICVDNDLNRCSGWWYVCSVNVE